MSYVLVRHKVEDYNKWKPLFDENVTERKEHGSKGGYVFRNADDSHELLVLLEWNGREGAKKFIESDKLRETMQEAGVTAQPEIFYLDETDRPKS
ncbi:cyclase [candidate division KSB1 bacterium]